ncbi:MAG: hypothetical protein IJU35_05615 [Paludibacteraceae bacterium]|nr:hypothetical protein [Paludibacteraceae bacterium]
MKKTIIFVLAFLCSSITFAQNTELPKSDREWLVGLDFGTGVPIEFHDIKAAGMSLHIGFDFARPINDRYALGFYISGGGGFVGELKPDDKYDKSDRFSGTLKFSAGVMMEIGELKNQPFLLGISPCAGFGLVDMDLILPVELRFGRMLANNWYIMGEITYGISLANETMSIEPTIRVGYNFGHKERTRKKR